MKTVFHRPLPSRISFAASVAVMLLFPLVAQAQGGNTITGYDALVNLAPGGGYNTADGFYSLYANTTGYYNTATGYNSLFSNTTGFWNTADGAQALLYNTTGSNNTANGVRSLCSNTTGTWNTANGVQALFANTTGYRNTADGNNTLIANTIGHDNAAEGSYALYSNTTGSLNTANGVQALYANTTGSSNIALGYGAGQYITTGSNNIAIGNGGSSADDSVIRIGTTGTHLTTYIAGISGATATGGVAVYVNSNGQLGTLSSSRRFKNDIKDMGAVSEKLMRLRPVTFRYKDSAEKGPHALQYGLIAEEVAKVYPDLVQYDKAGKPFTIYYHLLTPMLLNELQKEHRRNDARKSEIFALKAALKQQSSELAALKQTQQQQLKVLAKLAAFVQTSQAKQLQQNAVFVQH